VSAEGTNTQPEREPPQVMHLICGDKTLDLTRPCVMGVLNVTPDSFSDGGQFHDIGQALAHAHRMIDEGAAIIDIGGESTRPGANPVEVDEELHRVLPLVRSLARKVGVPISIDTTKPQVMQAVIDAGAGMINDILALRTPGALEVVAASNAAACLMHMQGEPRTMQVEPHYQDVIGEVHEFLRERRDACEASGIGRDRLVVDPGFGFGKAVPHNLSLLSNLDRFLDLDVPVLAGLSRKSMIGTITGRPVDQRLHGSIALATIAILKGARIIRAHDVAPAVDAVKIATAVIEGGGQ
jgi:dihydropteroate synthase